MGKRMSYHSFEALPVKVRSSIAAQILSEQWGYHIDSNPNKREKSFKKALVSFQKARGLAGNGMICEKTFDLLEISKYAKK